MVNNRLLAEELRQKAADLRRRIAQIEAAADALLEDEQGPPASTAAQTTPEPRTQLEVAHRDLPPRPAPPLVARSLPAPERVDAPVVTVTAAVRRYVQHEMPAGQDMTAEDVFSAIDWSVVAPTTGGPLNATRTALSRLVGEQLLERPTRGYYRRSTPDDLGGTSPAVVAPATEAAGPIMGGDSQGDQVGTTQAQVEAP
jgi:hypothetical protein